MVTLLYHWNFTGDNNLNENDKIYDSEANLSAVLKSRGTKSSSNYSRNENGIFSFETKRNLITNSSEFYNLSYEYMNDCLRAGLVYRREFYDDSELEAENSLMFKITIVPFGEIDTPSFKN